MDLTDKPVDGGVLKIKAKIREGRFGMPPVRPWMKWSALVGLSVGFLLAVWTCWWGRPPWRTKGFFVLSPWETIIVWSLAGALLGWLGSALVFGLIQFARPVYVALFGDVAQFEREYGSTAERVRKSL